MYDYLIYFLKLPTDKQTQLIALSKQGQLQCTIELLKDQDEQVTSRKVKTDRSEGAESQLFNTNFVKPTERTLLLFDHGRDNFNFCRIWEFKG